MIRIFSFRKIIITTLFLLLAIILYNYPSDLEKHISYQDIAKRNIYLIDMNDYVVMTKDSYNSILDLITLLKDNNDGERFKGLIPSNTKVLSYEINNGILSIDFSKDIMDIESDKSILMLESLIYSCTSLENIDKIAIFVEGNHLDYVPNTNIKLDYYLDRNFGINTIYNIDSINNTSSVTVYYSKDDYFIPITLVSNDSSDKMSIIINSLSSNKVFDSNLSNQISNNVKLLNYDYDEEVIDLNFDDCLFDYVLDGTLKEEVKYTLFYSIYDTFGVKNVTFRINNEYIDNFRLANS